MLFTKETEKALLNRVQSIIDRRVIEETTQSDLKIAELMDAMATLTATVAALREEIPELFKKTMEDERTRRFESDEPFVEIVSENFDADSGGVQLRLDWNSAFVNNLKKAGFTGQTEEAIVDSWLVALSRARQEESSGGDYK